MYKKLQKTVFKWTFQLQLQNLYPYNIMYLFIMNLSLNVSLENNYQHNSVDHNKLFLCCLVNIN